MSDKNVHIQQADHTVVKMTIISVTIVLFACIVVFTTLALIIIDEIPFHHLFDTSECGIGMGIGMVAVPRRKPTPQIRTTIPTKITIIQGFIERLLMEVSTRFCFICL